MKKWEILNAEPIGPNAEIVATYKNGQRKTYKAAAIYDLLTDENTETIEHKATGNYIAVAI